MQVAGTQVLGRCMSRKLNLKQKWDSNSGTLIGDVGILSSSLVHCARCPVLPTVPGCSAPPHCPSVMVSSPIPTVLGVQPYPLCQGAQPYPLCQDTQHSYSCWLMELVHRWQKNRDTGSCPVCPKHLEWLKIGEKECDQNPSPTRSGQAQ